MPRVLIISLLLATTSLHANSDSLAHYLHLLGTAESEKERLMADTIFHSLIVEALKAPSAFEEPFEYLDKIGKMTSSDGKVRIINWNVPLDKGKHRYRCMVLVKDKKGSHNVHELRMPERPAKKINERKVLSTDQWYGALYYEIIPVKKGAKTYYTLMGWSGKDRLSTRKVIDVLSISGKRVKLGAPIFQLQDNAQYRVVFEYSEEVRMGLGFDENGQRIVYDHLTPISSDLEGQYQFYGPDGSYDALVWEKSKWLLEPDVKVEGAVNAPYNAPKPPDPGKLKR